MDVWIKHPRLWAAASDKAARDLPRWTKSFWRKVSEVYQDLGGKFEETQDEME